MPACRSSSPECRDPWLCWLCSGRIRGQSGRTGCCRDPQHTRLQCTIENSRFFPKWSETTANNTAGPPTQCGSNPVSGRKLPKTGIFQMSAGDYRPFLSENAQSRGLETRVEFAKARHWRAFLRVSGAVSLTAGLGREDSNPEMVNWKSRANTLKLTLRKIARLRRLI